MSLADLAKAVAARRLPAVEAWAPARTGDSHMRIAADGAWFHEGGRITRPAMVRAFSALLTRDGAGQHWLVTPAEKLTIEVEDAAFIATDMEVRQDADGRPVIAFRLNTDDLVLAGPDHSLRAAGSAEVVAARADGVEHAAHRFSGSRVAADETQRVAARGLVARRASADGAPRPRGLGWQR